MAVNEYDQQNLSASQQAQIQGLTDQWNKLEEQHVALREQETALRNSGDTAGADAIRSQINGIKQQKSDLNTQAEAIRASQGYLSGQAGMDYIEIPQQQQQQQQVATIPGVTATAPATSGADLVEKWKEQIPQVDVNAMVNQWKGNVPNVDQTKANQQALLNQWQNNALQQSNNQIDHAVNQGVTELERTLADAQPQFKEQQESITKDEMQARDNSALYAEARGDKGGIGQEQYNSIMNTAAQNRLAVQQAQTKLATDIQRQIADLRAQGEFDKADAALEISQQYLSQLITLEQWAFDAGLNVAQFKASLDQWAADYQLAMAQFTTGLDQWAASYDFDVNKFLTSVEQWNKEFAFNQQQAGISNNQWQQSFNLDKEQFEYGKEQDKISNDLSYGQLTGIIPSTGQQTLNYQEYLTNQQKNLADQALNMALSGLVENLSPLQYEAIKTVYGADKATVDNYITAAKLAAENEQALEWAKVNKSNSGSDDESDEPKYVSSYQQAYNAGCRTYEDAYAFYLSKEGGGYSKEEAAELATYFGEKWSGNKTGFLNLPDYNTILKNSEAGLYGPEFGAVLMMVQNKWTANKDNEAIAEYLEKKLNEGKINEYGVAVIMQALGM